MKALDLSYIAGYLDGEGSIRISKSRRIATTSPQHTLSVEITNTHVETLRWIAERIGIGMVRCVSRARDWKPVWRWVIVSNQAYDFLGVILPYLKQKRPQAELGMDFYERRRTNAVAGLPGGQGGSGPLLQVEMQKREGYYQRMKVLNKRGAS